MECFFEDKATVTIEEQTVALMTGEGESIYIEGYYTPVAVDNTCVMINILEDVNPTLNECSNNNTEFSFFIKISSLGDFRDLTFDLPLEIPIDYRANCSIVITGSSEDTSEEYLKCSIEMAKIINQRIAFYEKYDWFKIGITVYDWDKYIQDPVVTESATCPAPAYKFTNLTYDLVRCDDWNQAVVFNGILVKGLTADEHDTLNFDLNLLLDGVPQSSNCSILNLSEEYDGLIMECMFEGKGQLNIEEQLVRLNTAKENQFILIEGFNQNVTINQSCVVINILSSIDKSLNECSDDNKEFIFYIKASTMGSADDFSFFIDLDSPEGSKANCSIMKRSITPGSQEEFLRCTVTMEKIVNQKFAFLPHYDWEKLGLSIHDWDKFITDPVISESTTCPSPTYKFTKLKFDSNKCQEEKHVIVYNGNYEKGLAAGDSDLEFTLKILLDNEEKDVDCSIFEVSSEYGNARMECTFSHTSSVMTIRIKDQFINLNKEGGKDYLFIEGTSKGNLISRKCVVINILSDVKTELSECSGDNMQYSFYIEASFLGDYKLFNFDLELQNPEKKARCDVFMSSHDINTTKSYLKCSLVMSSIINQNISLHEFYNWASRDFTMKNWEKNIKTIIISESASCPMPNSEFRNYELKKDSCQGGNHVVSFKGNYKLQSIVRDMLAETDLDSLFYMDFLVEGKEVNATCGIIVSAGEQKSTYEDTEMKCSFKGEGRLEINQQILNSNENRYIFVESFKGEQLTENCEEKSSSSSSWLKVSGLILLILLI